MTSTVSRRVGVERVLADRAPGFVAGGLALAKVDVDSHGHLNACYREPDRKGNRQPSEQVELS
jgi:hypothetical protein